MDNNSKWIWVQDNTRKNDHVVFKTTVTLAAPGEFVLEIAADTRYFMLVNDELVVLDGGLLGDAYCEHSGYIDSVDITEHLHYGENLIEIHVWHYGNGGRNNNACKHAGLKFCCPRLGLYSNSHTVCARHPAYYDPGEPHPSYLYGGDNLGYNANIPLSDSDFSPATEHECGPFDTLFPRPIPMFRFSDEIKCEYVKKPGGIYSVRLPEAHHVMPYFTVNAIGGEAIAICSDRFVVNGGPGDHYGRYNSHRTKYICAPGENHFLSHDYLACEELLFTIPDSVTVLELGYRLTEYDCDILDIPQTDDPDLNLLLKKCARTLKFCMRDNFMDCPDRERGQWIGDVSVQAPQVFYALTPSAVPLLKKAIFNFITLRKGDRLVGNVPGEHFSELPSQSLNAISELGMIAQYYEFTGDRSVIDLAFEPSVKYLLLWEMGEDGFVERRSGDWYWFDHLNNVDEKVLENEWYYSALRFALRMAEITGNHTYDSELTQRAGSISSRFDSAFWTTKHYYASGELVDDRANAMAVMVGLAGEDKYLYLRDVLVSTFNCSAYMEGYVCEALFRMGFAELGRKRMMSRYYNLIRNDSSTLWEDFFILGTKNHAWTGAPLTIFYRYIANERTL